MQYSELDVTLGMSARYRPQRQKSLAPSVGKRVETFETDHE